MSPPTQKMITDAVHLIRSAFERTITFLTTVHVMLEEYNNCLPNYKWLGVKHVLIVFGYIKGALLMISSTSNNTVWSCSK